LRAIAGRSQTNLGDTGVGALRVLSRQTVPLRSLVIAFRGGTISLLRGRQPLRRRLVPQHRHVVTGISCVLPG
ncbi:MAG: hypothetical protein M3327_05600, partial [Actinomycetota bacterium]|nr:hypothetical protein [Actinomycetota bacterium]